MTQKAYTTYTRFYTDSDWMIQIIFFNEIVLFPFNDNNT